MIFKFIFVASNGDYSIFIVKVKVTPLFFVSVGFVKYKSVVGYTYIHYTGHNEGHNTRTV